MSDLEALDAQPAFIAREHLERIRALVPIAREKLDLSPDEAATMAIGRHLCEQAIELVRASPNEPRDALNALVIALGFLRHLLAEEFGEDATSRFDLILHQVFPKLATTPLSALAALINQKQN